MGFGECRAGVASGFPAREGDGRLRQIGVRPQVLERRLGDDDTELRLDRDREFDEIEGIGAEIVGERRGGPELIFVHGQMLGHDRPQPRSDRGGGYVGGRQGRGAAQARADPAQKTGQARLLAKVDLFRIPKTGEKAGEGTL